MKIDRTIRLLFSKIGKQSGQRETRLDCGGNFCFRRFIFGGSRTRQRGMKKFYRKLDPLFSNIRVRVSRKEVVRSLSGIILKLRPIGYRFRLSPSKIILNMVLFRMTPVATLHVVSADNSVIFGEALNRIHVGYFFQR